MPKLAVFKHHFVHARAREIEKEEQKKELFLINSGKRKPQKYA